MDERGGHDQPVREDLLVRPPLEEVHMQTKFTVTLTEPDAVRLIALSRSHPAMRIHAAHVAAIRVGLRALEAAPDLLLSELAQIVEERPPRARPHGRAVTP